MKKYFKALALILVFVLLQSVCVQAMLTEEEQIANRKKKEQEVSVQTESGTEEVETEGSSETEIESEMETEEDSEAETESESETETEMETETVTVSAADEGDAPLVAIDPGHQAPGPDLSETEPNGPGSDTMRACMTEGTTGTVSDWDEYELNLEISLQLRDELEKRGYRVILTHETADVALSDIERCQLANDAGADILLHIHANDSTDSAVTGALASAPSYSNPYVSNIYHSCMKLADDVLDTYCETTGMHNRGIFINDQLTSINWSEMPATVLQLGYMTNVQDDAYMADPENQAIMVQGIANGIDVYFGR